MVEHLTKHKNLVKQSQNKYSSRKKWVECKHSNSESQTTRYLTKICCISKINRIFGKSAEDLTQSHRYTPEENTDDNRPSICPPSDYQTNQSDKPPVNR